MLHDLPVVSAFIDNSISVAAPRPPPFSFSPLLLAFSFSCRNQLFSTSALYHLAMKPSAALTILRSQSPACLAAVGHNTVFTSSNKGEVSIYPSLALNTVMPSPRHRAYVFPGRPGPGSYPLTIAPNITRRVSRSGFARCTAPAKRRRRLRTAVSTLSHWAFLRALAYVMRWLVRCRRWEVVIRTGSLWCALWTTAKCSTPRVHVTHPYSSVPITSDFSTRIFTVNEAVSISHRFRVNRSKHASRTRRLISGIMSAVSLIRPHW